jgi:hypothetical protein
MTKLQSRELEENEEEQGAFKEARSESKNKDITI